ncbi:YihY/virulence factor BrkB family protein [Streptomyces sp. HNM0574]|uniref:YihY/virulence factor BrkB family protein n=1 Tax=Streptomyces sp. HNM0574 TaxID=2714954 RepID=UPI00146A413D|nr:YihY/virulence factor BrkB family protein [Streptomyces sp. HNM0574]NLU66973.1 YihY/virulence factor BrkB family protein [Streptomyces sp. HNM0574]
MSEGRATATSAPGHRSEREPRGVPAPRPHSATSPAARAARRRSRRTEAWTALRRTPGRIWNDDVMDWAAALTYYAVLAIFPALLVSVSTVGIAGKDATRELIDQLPVLLPADAGDAMAAVLKDMAGQQTAAWLLATFGTVGALWFASSYLSVFRRALHSMYGVKDHRPVWRTTPRIVLRALALLAMLVSSVCVLVVSAEAARTVGELLGVGEAAVDAWNTVKWSLLPFLVAVLVLILFRTGPPVTGGVRLRVAGGALAVVLWLVASAGFALYTSHVPTYHRLYGSLAGVVVFLVWLWMTNLAFLVGAQFNAEVVRLRRPVPPDEDGTDAGT